jgi:hypothetical protein
VNLPEREDSKKASFPTHGMDTGSINRFLSEGQKYQGTRFAGEPRLLLKFRVSCGP